MAKRQSYANPRVLRAGPWQGVRDTTDPGDDDERFLARLTNGYIPDPAGASGAFARPGWKLLNSGSQLGASSGRKGQGGHQHTRLDGTEDSFVFVGGKMYRYDPDAETFSDITPTNIRLASTTRVYCTSFADRVIVNDGVNKPWAYNPATSTATAIEAYTPTITYLSIGTTDPKKVKSIAFYSSVDDAVAQVASAETSLPAVSIANNRWRSFRVSLSSAGVITINVSSADAVDEATAIAALPARPTGHWDMGYFTVNNAGGGTWVSGTNALAGGGGVLPATATNYYAGERQHWSAQGAPTVRSAKLMFAVSYLNGVIGRNAIMWSEEADPATGYQQTDYDNLWELTQTDPNALYAIRGTETGLYALRAYSGQIVYGDVDETFRTTNTRDPLTTGCTSPATFLEDDHDALWWADAAGRVVRLPVGSTDPVDVWLDMRRVVDDALAEAGASASLPTQACAAMVPGLDLVAFALWASDGASEPPTTLHLFDQRTAKYVGDWTIAGGVKLDALVVLKDAQKRPILLALGSNTTSAYATGNAGYAWRLRSADEGVWADTGVATNPCHATTHRLGDDATVEWLVSLVTARTASSAPCTLGYVTSRTSSGSVGAATPSTSSDTTNRCVWGTNAQGRGPQFTVTPTTATAQWGLHRLIAEATPLPATPSGP